MAGYLKSFFLLTGGAVLILVLAAVVLSDYSSLLPLIVGIAAGVLIVYVLSDAGRERLKHPGSSLIWYIALGVVIVVLSTLYALAPQQLAPIPCQPGAQANAATLTGYSAVITPVDFASNKFTVQEHLTYTSMAMRCSEEGVLAPDGPAIEKNGAQDLPPREISAEPRGLFIREIVLDVAHSPALTIQNCCDFGGKIEAQKFPYKSFYEAQYALNLKQDEYLGEETITWDHQRLSDGVRFAYIPAPFYNVVGLVTPFIEISKFNGWLLTLIGFAASFIFANLLKPRLVKWVESWFSADKPPVKSKKTK